jgi:citrate lyase beta subunit
MRLRRSLLFVPGAEPRKLERARDAGADTGLLDLEDSVAPQRKAEARQSVAATLHAGGFGNSERAVRVIEAWEHAQAEGRGVFTLDGKMIDAPLVAVQQRVLERARRAGALAS